MTWSISNTAAGLLENLLGLALAAALCAMERRAAKVDGIYDRDPRRHPDAKMLEKVSYDRFFAGHLGVMDSTAIALCREHSLPIRVFKMARGNIRRVCLGEPGGTTGSTG